MCLFYVLCTILKINSHYFPARHLVGGLDNVHGNMFIISSCIQ